MLFCLGQLFLFFTRFINNIIIDIAIIPINIQLTFKLNILLSSTSKYSFSLFAYFSILYFSLISPLELLSALLDSCSVYLGKIRLINICAIIIVITNAINVIPLFVFFTFVFSFFFLLFFSYSILFLYNFYTYVFSIIISFYPVNLFLLFVMYM